jgi:hypothetical protein
MDALLIAGEDPPVEVLHEEFLLEYRAAIIGFLRGHKSHVGTRLIAIAFVVHRGELRYQYITSTNSVRSICDDYTDFIEEVTGRYPCATTEKLATVRIRVGWRQSGHTNHVMVIIHRKHDPFVLPIQVTKNEEASARLPDVASRGVQVTREGLTTREDP